MVKERLHFVGRQSTLHLRFYIVRRKKKERPIIYILEKGHDRSADFYSLGALIYEMISGAPPYYSKDKK